MISSMERVEVVRGGGERLPLKTVYRYPHGEMEVGEWFEVPNLKVSDKQKVYNANYRAGRRLGRKFIARVEGEWIRVWRVG